MRAELDRSGPWARLRALEHKKLLASDFDFEGIKDLLGGWHGCAEGERIEVEITTSRIETETTTEETTSEKYFRQFLCPECKTRCHMTEAAGINNDGHPVCFNCYAETTPEETTSGQEH